MAVRKRKKTALKIFQKVALIAVIAGAVIAIYPFFTDFYAWHNTNQRLQELESPRLETSPGFAERDFICETEFTGAVLKIPVIGLIAVVEKGTSQQVLAKAVGWYEESMLPGEGNTAIAGHRTMYGGKFKNIHLLKFGDIITLEYRGEIYTYTVDKVFSVESTDWSVIEPRAYPTLTLTTCYPGDNYTRRVVFANMITGTDDIMK